MARVRPYSPSLLYRLEYAIFLLAGAFLTALPVELASAAGGRILRLIGPFQRKSHTRMLENLAKAFPDMGKSERIDLALGVWENLGRVLAEFFHLQEIARDRIVCENPEVLAQLAAEGRGSVICGAHQANWEAASGILLRHDLKPMCVYHPMSNPFIDAAVRRRREPLYPGGYVAKGHLATPRKLIRHVRNRETAVFLVDQYKPKGLPILLFGRLAASVPFPSEIARTQQVPLVVLHMKRMPGVRFIITCEPVPFPISNDLEDDVFRSTAAVQSALERSIRRRPEQWMMWKHKRWD